MVAQDRDTIEELEQQLAWATTQNNSSSGGGGAGSSHPQQEYDAPNSCVVTRIISASVSTLLDELALVWLAVLNLFCHQVECKSACASADASPNGASISSPARQIWGCSLAHLAGSALRPSYTSIVSQQNGMQYHPMLLC
eukprot:COSAG02_NODE_1492_length_12334_cov_29.721945_13_plen_140_part_00